MTGGYVKKQKSKNENRIIAAAKKYVNQQLATMKKHGSAPNLSAEAYDALVRKVAAASM